ncbi:hypothetical protein CEXT_578031 [Caerostris extrusa]|uniref:Uncharacterized protein n=1 Tax=Caerostris extrusa TaxID=172846 RepID=A0AAV4QKP0_CAEEX|nr:hypothetical protein CEXT_578031 [Caerostris extrusa]
MLTRPPYLAAISENSNNILWNLSGPEEEMVGGRTVRKSEGGTEIRTLESDFPPVSTLQKIFSPSSLKKKKKKMFFHTALMTIRLPEDIIPFFTI